MCNNKSDKLFKYTTTNKTHTHTETDISLENHRDGLVSDQVLRDKPIQLRATRELQLSEAKLTLSLWSCSQSSVELQRERQLTHASNCNSSGPPGLALLLLWLRLLPALSAGIKAATATWIRAGSCAEWYVGRRRSCLPGWPTAATKAERQNGRSDDRTTNYIQQINTEFMT